MFTVPERERLRAELIAAARADERIAGAALTGSAAAGREDRWSDVDLAFGLAPRADLAATIGAWSDRMYAEHAAVHHVDVRRGGTVYRVFLLASSLQVDLAFSPADEFGAIAPTFRLLFGTAGRPAPAEPPTVAELAGMGWLYALHARSSIARGRVWQAEYMMSGVRDHVVALACLRHGVPAHQGRGVDDLPADVTAAFAGTLVRSVEARELRRAFRCAADVLLAEIDRADRALAARLTPAVELIADSTPPP